MYARLRCGGNLPQCLAFGTGVLGVLWWLGGWVVGIRYRKQAFTVRNMRAVLKKASWGTRRIFGGTRCKKQASTVRKRYSVHENPLFLHGRRFQRNSVLKTGFSGTRRIRGVPCQKQPPAAPDASSVRETAPALFVRSGGPFPCSFDGTRDQKRPPLGCEQT